jgi:hypothetical protein
MYDNGVNALPMTGVGVLISTQLTGASYALLSLAVLFVIVGMALLLTARHRD